MKFIYLSFLLVFISACNHQDANTKVYTEKLNTSNDLYSTEQQDGKTSTEETYNEKARNEHRLAKDTEALNTYTEALKVYPESFVLRNNLAHFYIDIQEYDKASAELKILIRSNMDKKIIKKSYIDLFKLYKNHLQDYNSAIKYMNIASAIYPNDANILYHLAQTYHYQLKNTAKAKEYYKKYLILRPTDTMIQEVYTELTQSET
jgi:tetratricopeptide (TPR) repeat protein